MSTNGRSERGGRGDAPALALVGCGAIARSFHLPALARRPDVVGRLVLVDPDLERARALGGEFGVTRFARDHREVVDEVDAAIILTPHHLHAPIATSFLEKGRSVLSEKPLSESASEVRALMEVARDAGAHVAVNNTRRLIPACARVRELIAAEAVGPLVSMDCVEGDKFDWPTASGSMFGRQGSGKGVLLDIGAHVLDLVCWWLDGTPRLLGYRDDSLGGSEAVAQVDMEHRGCRVGVRLSWLSKLRNSYVIVGERGRIEWGIYDWRTVSLTDQRGRRRVLTAGPADIRTYPQLAVPLIDNFLRVVAGDAEPLVSAADVLPSVGLIEACYADRTPFEMPWHDTLSRILPAYA